MILLDHKTFPLDDDRFYTDSATWLIPERIDRPELLDLGVGSPEEVRRCLADLGRINRYLGGITGITDHLYPRLKQRAQPATVVDLGAGAGQISAAIARWAQSQALTVRVIALDLSARNLAIASEQLDRLPNAFALQGDVHQLPLAERGADYVISSLFLHHFNPTQVVKILRAAYAASQRGIIMNDLVRGWLPWVAFQCVQPIFARSYLTRHDGALSVRRAYTPQELYKLALAARIPNPKVYSYFPWRMTLVAER
ncbi:MAG: methyltransferase domain-containing protein [Anaerolineae bacterium]|nr:methyltransferase domain-containing protein [Anaerolineae bacterium]